MLIEFAIFLLYSCLKPFDMGPDPDLRPGLCTADLLAGGQASQAQGIWLGSRARCVEREPPSAIFRHSCIKCRLQLKLGLFFYYFLIIFY